MNYVDRIKFNKQDVKRNIQNILTIVIITFIEKA